MKTFCISTLLFLTLVRVAVSAQNITFSEINYKCATSLDCGDWFELHNYGTTSIDISGWKVKDSIGSNVFKFPINTIMSANSYLVVFKNAATFTNFYPSVTNAIGNFGFKLSSSDSLILLDSFNNAIVGMYYNSNKYWPDGADGEGRTMELKNQNSNIGLSNPSSWRDGCMLGSPGAAPLACNDTIIFTEINYNSDSMRDIGEFVELYNTTNNSFNLSNWYLRDGIDSVQNKYTFAAGTVLAAGAYLVVSNDTASLFKYKTKKNNFLGNFTFNLNNGGEQIRLFNDNNELKFSFHYRDSIPWTDSADGRGYTLEIKDKLGATNDGKNYFAGCLGGSPGEAYNPVCKTFAPLGLQPTENTFVLVYPILVNDVVNIENAFPDYEKVQLIDASGRLLQSKKIQKGVTTFFINNYTKGIYYIVLKNKNGFTQCKKVIKF